MKTLKKLEKWVVSIETNQYIWGVIDTILATIILFGLYELVKFVF